MRNFKYLCLLFVIFTANRVICLPLNEKSCSIPPELMISFGIELNDNFKKCEDDKEIKYCEEIQHLLSDISNCSLGKVWDMKELREKFIGIKQMPFDDKIDICLNFGNFMKIIELNSFGEKSVGVQLTRNSDICAEFCTRQPKICPLLLKLYWIKNVLMDVSNEMSKPNELPKTFPTQKAIDQQLSDSIQPLDHSTNPEKSETQNLQTTAEKSSLSNKVTANKMDNSEKDDKLSNIKSPVTNLTNAGTKNTLTTTKQIIPLLTNDAHAKLPENKNIEEQAVQLEKKQSIGQQTKDTKPLTKTVADSESKTKVSATVADKNPTTSNSIEKNVKKEVSKKLDDSSDKKIAGELENKSPPDDKPTVQPNSVKENPSESENGLNQESEKTDKAEFGNQPNEFSEEFADPVNEYVEEEQQLPPTINAGKVETKADVNKKYEMSLGKDNNRIGTEFPEEGGHFFAYFLTIIVLCIAGYLVFHNKQKIIALIIEGRHERRRRPNGGYKRLDSKDSSKTTSQVIF